jgi:hypothetical protein
MVRLTVIGHPASMLGGFTRCKGIVKGNCAASK